MDTLVARCYEPLLGRVLRPLRAAVAGLCPPGPVLDCCCGAGGLAALLTGEGRTVTGVDNDAAMLAMARRTAPMAQFLHGDARELPFAAGSFAAACVCLALHAMPPVTAAAVLAQLRRVARTVIVADYALAERNLAVPAVGMAHGVEWLVGGEHYRWYGEYMRAGAIEGLLAREGLRPSARVSVLGGAATVAACGGMA